MPYVPTDWVDDVTPIDAARMDNLDQGVAALANGNPPSPVGQEGKWVRSVSGAIVWQAAPYLEKAHLSAKGDIITSAAADTGGRITVGADGQILSADTATQLPKWITPPVEGATWTAFTPGITASPTPPTLGGTSLLGRYATFGKFMHVQIQITCGSGWAPGSGQYSIYNFPVIDGAMHGWLGWGVMRKSSNAVICVVARASTTAVGLYYLNTYNGGLYGVTNNQPWTWSATPTNDSMNFWFWTGIP